jgi:hypothetical protein
VQLRTVLSVLFSTFEIDLVSTSQPSSLHLPGSSKWPLPTVPPSHHLSLVPRVLAQATEKFPEPNFHAMVIGPSHPCTVTYKRRKPLKA